jgi:hypothetical protein
MYIFLTRGKIDPKNTAAKNIAALAYSWRIKDQLPQPNSHPHRKSHSLR